MNPMLSKPIDQDTLIALITDENWAFSPKLDGKRFLASVKHQDVKAFGRNGQTIEIPSPIRDALYYRKLTATGVSFVVDGELMASGNLILFDLVEANIGVTNVTAKDSYGVRYQVLQTLYNHIWNYKTCPIKLLKHAVNHKDKVQLCYEILSDQGEGVVARLMDASYQMGQRSADSGKFKIIKTVDCIVTGTNFDGRDNLVLSVYSNGKLKEVGRVSALTGEGQLAKIGDVVEVKYLTYNTKLVQPTFPRIRSDKSPTECTIDQLTAVNMREIESNWLVTQ